MKKPRAVGNIQLTKHIINNNKLEMWVGKNHMEQTQEYTYTNQIPCKALLSFVHKTKDKITEFRKT